MSAMSIRSVEQTAAQSSSQSSSAGMPGGSSGCKHTTHASTHESSAHYCGADSSSSGEHQELALRNGFGKQTPSATVSRCPSPDDNASSDVSMVQGIEFTTFPTLTPFNDDDGELAVLGAMSSRIPNYTDKENKKRKRSLLYVSSSDDDVIYKRPTPKRVKKSELRGQKAGLNESFRVSGFKSISNPSSCPPSGKSRRSDPGSRAFPDDNKSSSSWLPHRRRKVSAANRNMRALSLGSSSSDTEDEGMAIKENKKIIPNNNGKEDPEWKPVLHKRAFDISDDGDEDTEDVEDDDAVLRASVKEALNNSKNHGNHDTDNDEDNGMLPSCSLVKNSQMNGNHRQSNHTSLSNGTEPANTSHQGVSTICVICGGFVLKSQMANHLTSSCDPATLMTVSASQHIDEEVHDNESMNVSAESGEMQTCPVCDALVLATMINEHLDDCINQDQGDVIPCASILSNAALVTAASHIGSHGDVTEVSPNIPPILEDLDDLDPAQQCPICQFYFRATMMNGHLDKCLANQCY